MKIQDSVFLITGGSSGLGAATALAAGDVPPWTATPAAADAIAFDAGVLSVPQ